MRNRRQISLIFTSASLVVVLFIFLFVMLINRDFHYKNYKNNGYGFQIKYPDDWMLKEGFMGSSVIFVSPLENAMDLTPESLNVTIQDISASPMSLEDYTALTVEQMKMMFKENIEILEDVDVTLAGQPGHRFVYLAKGPNSKMRYMHEWTLKGTSAYQITFGAVDSQYDARQPQVNKMLSSFRLK